jgi:hypothetical protein
MLSMTRSVVLLTLLSMTSCAARPASLQGSYDKRLLELEKQRDKLKRQTDAVGRTKTNIKISEILLSLVSDAIRGGDSELMEHRLEEYVSAIQDAHQTMTKTGRDAHRQPKGFKDLEIALRRQVRQLDDISQILSFDQREAIDKAKNQASDIRDELLKALFGEQNAPARKG